MLPQRSVRMAANTARSPLVFVLLTVLIDTIGFGIIMPVLPRLIMQIAGVELPAAARLAGLLLLVFALLQFLFGPVMGNLSDAYGRRPVLLISLLSFGLNYALMGLAPSLGWLFIGRALTGISGAVYAPANAFVADVTQPEKRAQSFGLIGAAFGLGFILGPAIGGLRPDRADEHAGTLLGEGRCDALSGRGLPARGIARAGLFRIAAPPSATARGSVRLIACLHPHGSHRRPTKI
jgi:MFS family permease